MTMSIIQNRKSIQLIKIMNQSLWDLPSPSSVSYFWNFGATLGICLTIQILTGLLLTFHYTAFSEESFNSVALIMREIWSGWFIRFVHMNGASMFFIFLYMHMFRGIFFMSSSHKNLWSSGVLILIMLMAISFLGYVLPWGQMSYWAVAVITNLFSIVPFVGEELICWIWGGFSVNNPTLIRFYSLHFLLPFILMFTVFIHLLLLHAEGSSSNMGLNSNMDKVEFHPYFSSKDMFFILVVTFMFFMISFFYPYVLGDAVNNVPANPMQTPQHIQPEWYFLVSYAILRSLPSKVAGVLALLFSVTVFFILPLYNLKFSTKFSFYRFMMFWMLISCFFFLMKMGSMPAEEPYVKMSLNSTMLYFFSILFLNI